ncbi:hypothetical protein HW555_008790 [Spodoptera exigua]|uniref:Uncharacterized protein n=1 Tax=Spodoptera exigua TaxID=7107 RepID=A0A835GBW8_SPOEX|nr:hypothetical protein HW555_008790 [Spodoptera exigua]
MFRAHTTCVGTARSTHLNNFWVSSQPLIECHQFLYANIWANFGMGIKCLHQLELAYLSLRVKVISAHQLQIQYLEAFPYYDIEYLYVMVVSGDDITNWMVLGRVRKMTICSGSTLPPPRRLGASPGRRGGGPALSPPLPARPRALPLPTDSDMSKQKNKELIIILASTTCLNSTEILNIPVEVGDSPSSSGSISSLGTVVAGSGAGGAARDELGCCNMSLDCWRRCLRRLISAISRAISASISACRRRVSSLK